MSFDLGVWHVEESLTDEEAAAIYLRLCEEWPYLEGEHPAVAAFYEELVRRWPEIDTIPEERVGDCDFCPWSCALNRSGIAVVVSCVWPKAVEVGEYVATLARKHGLLLFDPQSSRVFLPDQFRPSKGGFIQRFLRKSR